MVDNFCGMLIFVPFVVDSVVMKKFPQALRDHGGRGRPHS